MKQELSANELYLQNQKLTQDIALLSKKLEKSENHTLREDTKSDYLA